MDFPRKIVDRKRNRNRGEARTTNCATNTLFIYMILKRIPANAFIAAEFRVYAIFVADNTTGGGNRNFTRLLNDGGIAAPSTSDPTGTLERRTVSR